jgi:predicted nucleic acid-binding protein
MMTVCIETNFVLRLALRQQQWEECDRIVRAAEAGCFTLVLPILSLFEALSMLRRKRDERLKQAADWKKLARELERTEHAPHKQSAAHLVEASTQVTKLLDIDREELAKVTHRLGQCAQMLPLDTAQFATAYEHERAGLKSADALILTSILGYRGNVEGGCFFLTFDSDFKASAPVVEALEKADIQLVYATSALLQRLGEQGLVLPR